MENNGNGRNGSNRNAASSDGRRPLDREAFVSSEANKLIENERLLVAIDAYVQGYGVLADVVEKAFLDPRAVRMKYDPIEFGAMLGRIAKKIKLGEIKVPSKARSAYKHFYSE